LGDQTSQEKEDVLPKEPGLEKKQAVPFQFLEPCSYVVDVIEHGETKINRCRKKSVFNVDGKDNDSPSRRRIYEE